MQKRISSCVRVGVLQIFRARKVGCGSLSIDTSYQSGAEAEQYKQCCENHLRGIGKACGKSITESILWDGSGRQCSPECGFSERSLVSEMCVRTCSSLVQSNHSSVRSGVCSFIQSTVGKGVRVSITQRCPVITSSSWENRHRLRSHPSFSRLRSSHHVSISCRLMYPCPHRIVSYRVVCHPNRSGHASRGYSRLHLQRICALSFHRSATA